ncbi:MAG: hypothetical protein Q4A75_08790 [Peptostreptococcaceae bacterium]|nr:hypothetical protein [Peptostreptococcaceae bacterium]
MNKIWTYLPGITWILCGFILNKIIMVSSDSILLFILGLGFLFLWGSLAYKIHHPGENTFTTACILNGVGSFMLVLVLVQELIVGQYSLNWSGIIPQMYFLPCLSVTSTLSKPVLGIIMETIHVWPIYILEFILMLFVSLIGCEIKQKRADL